MKTFNVNWDENVKLVGDAAGLEIEGDGWAIEMKGNNYIIEIPTGNINISFAMKEHGCVHEISFADGNLEGIKKVKV